MKLPYILTGYVDGNGKKVVGNGHSGFIYTGINSQRIEISSEDLGVYPPPFKSGVVIYFNNMTYYKTKIPVEESKRMGILTTVASILNNYKIYVEITGP